MSHSDIKNVGIVGMGFIFPRHLEAAKRNDLKVTVVCDSDLSKKDKTPEGAEFVRTFAEVVSHPDVDMVSILTPNNLHAQIAFDANNLGKVVLLEKPPCLSKHELDVLISRGEGIYVCLQMRYHPEFKKLKTIVAESTEHLYGSLVVRVKRDPSYWEGWKGDDEQSGGLLYNIGIHYFDVLTSLFGEEIDVIVEDYQKHKASGILDFKKATISYDVEILSDAEGQTRHLEIHDIGKFTFSTQDNLSMEDLHATVYGEILDGRGIPISEAGKVISLLEKLK